MKKLNNKGMSLIELIISFSLVCVAVIYFFETLFITNKIFRTTKEDTKRYVDVAYVFNIIEYYVNSNEFKDVFINDGFSADVDLSDDDGEGLAFFNMTNASKYLDQKLFDFSQNDNSFKWSIIDDGEAAEPTLYEIKNLSNVTKFYIKQSNINNVTTYGHMFSYRFKVSGKEYYYFFATSIKTD